ncbi:MAG TPA: type III-B CRISPR module RAMP protein Cmr4 [Gammaproteobacteria bacterium]|nr:type III-B CRISPR module RAMP protein Cmr4 [Gammaproteobacteria bacterium]
MSQQNAIFGLLAQTSLHAGTGQNSGIIDLPIQREGHNGWPCVFGSAVKGALRTCAEDRYGASNESINHVFGPDTDHAADHAGAIAVSDARLLLLPIRSLTSQFKWVTCPDALKRFKRDCQRLDLSMEFDVPELDERGEAQALVSETQKGGQLFLEEYCFNAKPVNLKPVIDSMARLMNRDDAVAELGKQLTVISNDDFTYLVQHATPVNAHIAIESETKTVRDGALWYEETLPPETLLYTTLSAAHSRKDRKEMPASAILKSVKELFQAQNWLQLGGNETVGMGWCAVSILESGDQ